MSTAGITHAFKIFFKTAHTLQVVPFSWSSDVFVRTKSSARYIAWVLGYIYLIAEVLNSFLYLYLPPYDKDSVRKKVLTALFGIAYGYAVVTVWLLYANSHSLSACLTSYLTFRIDNGKW